jgi:hypothetical protein
MELATPARVSRKAVWGGPMRLLLALPIVMLGAGCGELHQQGTASSYLIVNSLDAASGAEPNRFSGTLQSDVVTVVAGSPTIFNDFARVRLTMALKDPGGSELPTTPTSNNFITIDRYHVRYFRADGRSEPGVDVPYAFDGAFTLTVRGNETTGSFTLVRHQAKAEAPLAGLARNRLVISTLAEITFFGHDQTGREVSTLARITVDFANFGDPGGGGGGDEDAGGD